MTIVLAFRAGGFFPGVTAILAAVLVVALAMRITLAPRPFAGWSVPLAVVASGLALYACWILASAGWSDAPARAVTEFDRVLLYLSALVLLGSFGVRDGDLGTLLRWLAAALAGICLAALLTRLLPHELPTRAGLRTERLSFPTTYWNATGLVAGLAAVLTLHVSSARGEHPVARALAAAALPVVAVTLYFTFSRGAIAATLLGVLAYMVIAHPRGLLTTLAAAGPPTALALHEAYGAELLASEDYASAAAGPQARHVLLVVLASAAVALVLRVLLLAVDRRLAGVRLAVPRRRPVRALLAIAAVLGVIATAVAIDAPRRLDEQRDAFVKGSSLPRGGDQRRRLTTPGNNGRLAHWRVSRRSFAAEPLHGSGAGTYRLEWERYRPDLFQVTDAHSLYFEVAGELGVVGLVLLAIAMLGPLAVAASRLRGPGRHAHAAFLAAGGMLAIHAGVDWDWEMPVLFAWFFAASGVVLAAREDRVAMGGLPRLGRLLAGLACLFVAVTPALVGLSQAPLNRAKVAFTRNDCPVAIDEALNSIERFRPRPEPYEILGYCDLRLGRRALALEAMRSARRRDPRNWEYAYGLAVAQALAGEDPRREIRAARRLNPRSELAHDLEERLRGDDPARWRRAAARAKLPVAE